MWRIGRVLKTGAAVLGGLAVTGLTFGFIYERVAERREAARYPARGRLVNIGGRNLFLNCMGEGSPTVVLDSALGMTSYTWWPVQVEIAGITRVCSYDRAGYALSDPGPLPRTSRQIAQELRALLSTAQVPGPYILAGHSLGGLNVRLFATTYPAEVAGVALIDATPDDVFDRLPVELRPMVVPNVRQMKVAAALAE